MSSSSVCSEGQSRGHAESVRAHPQWHMLSVIGRPQAQYNYACLQAREHCRSLDIQEPVCRVANFLFPDGRVIAGHKEVQSGAGHYDKYKSTVILLFYLIKLI